MSIKSSIERDMIDLVRSIMYAGAEDNENMCDEIADLGRLLALYDDVPYEADKNRLVQAMRALKKYSRIWKQI